MTKRKNITMSEEIAQWYEDKANELGVTQTALMTIALKQYIDQEKAINVMQGMKQLIEDVETIKKQIKK